MFIGGPQRHPFWSAECPSRGGVGLTHVQNGEPRCSECGDTPEGWDAVQARLKALNEYPEHVFAPTITGLCLRCRRGQAEGNHPASVGTPPIMEPRLAHHTYGDAPKRDQAIHGRDALTAEWKSWARIELTPIDSEYR